MNDAAAFDLSQYNYVLPPELIAQSPAEPRDSSRLLVMDRRSGETQHAVFREIGRFLRAGDLLVLNNTKVFPARTIGARTTTGRIEVFFLRDRGEGIWEALVRAHGNPRPGEFVNLEGGRLRVRLAQKLENGHWTIALPRGLDLLQALEEIGRTPLPPYIKRGEDRAHESGDRARYQTVFARHAGAVAAPTAGLHFTRELLDALRAAGVGTAEVTLHVGPGTFQPIKVQDIRLHAMHEEYYAMAPDSAARIAETKRAGGRVIAVGTTACRTLEAAAAAPAGFGPGEAWTKLYVFPPYEFRIVDALLTNFHLPKSTLLLLVSAFAGRERILAAYEEAKRQGYRFYSYGDAMLIV